MIKRAQPYDPSEFTGYGQGGLAGYGQQGYDVGLENVGLLPGMDPRVPERSRMPGIVSPWAVPISVAAGGLIGVGLLRHLGKRLAANAARKVVQRGAAATAAPTATTIDPETARLVQKYLPKQANLIEMLGAITRR